MKKVALSLLAFAMVGAMAFGQDAAVPVAKIGGYLDMGTLTLIKADSGASTIVKGDDSGIVGGSYEFRGSYGLSDKAGLVFNVRFQNLTAPLSATNGATAPTLAGTIYNVQSAYAWFKLPGLDSVEVLAGNFGNDGTAWNAVDDRGDKATAGTGVAVEVTPVDGFTLGAGLIPSVDGYTPPTYSAGATYTVPSTVLVQAALKTANKAWAAALDNAYFGGKLLLAGPFSAKGDVNLFQMSQAGSMTNTITDVTLGYNVTDAFSVGLLTYIYTYGGDVKAFNTTSFTATDSAALGMKINPSVSYTVNPVVAVGLGGTYFSGPNVLGVGDGTAATDNLTSGVVLNGISQMEVNPNATFTIDANTKVYVNYLYDAVSGSDIDNINKVRPAASKIKDLSWSTFKIDYRYTF